MKFLVLIILLIPFCNAGLGINFDTPTQTINNIYATNTSLLAELLQDYRLQSWNNLTGIPHATPSNGDTTHFSLANEIYEWVIGLTYATTTYVDNLVATYTSVSNFTNDAGYYNLTDFSISDYIPYTGATTNVDLGANNFLINNSVFFVNSTSGNTGIGTASPGTKLDVRGNITVNNTILSPTGTLRLGGTGGTYNEDLILDFETAYANRVALSSGTGANLYLGFLYTIWNDNKYIALGDSTDVLLKWQTVGNDNFQIGTGVGSADYSGYVSLMEKADRGNANRSPTSTSADPVLRVYSSDASQADDYIEMYHDQNNAHIKIGQHSLIQNVADGKIILQQSGTSILNFQGSSGTDQALIGLEDGSGNHLIIINDGNGWKDHDHPVQTDPTLYIHSDTNPDTDNTEWGSLAYINATDSFDLDVGKGDLKILPSATGDVELFGGTDVGDAENGKYFYIHRRAAEGDSYFRAHQNSFKHSILYSTDRMKIETITNPVSFQASGLNNVDLFYQITSGNPGILRQSGYITASSASKYIQWQVSDTTDNFELTREDANITAFDIQMPLVTDEITIGGDASLADTNKVYFGTAQDVSMEMNGTSFNILDEVSSIVFNFQSFLKYVFDANVEVKGSVNATQFIVNESVGYTGTCANITYSGGIAISCND